MGEIRKFDRSRSTHWRSNDKLEGIHKNLPWNRKPAIRWGMVALVFAGAALATQLGMWEYQRIEARKLALSAIPQGKTWRSCAEVRDAGVVPLFPADPGYNLFLDADGDGVACEPHLATTIEGLRWKLWGR
jgi:hypothetical protein